MGHYDGPVFLRRQQTIGTAKKAAQSSRRHVVPPAKRQTRPSTRQKQPLVRQRHFTPKHIPKSVQTAQQTDEELRLARYVQQLTKAKTSFLLFAPPHAAHSNAVDSAAKAGLHFLPAAAADTEVPPDEISNVPPQAESAAAPQSAAKSDVSGVDRSGATRIKSNVDVVDTKMSATTPLSHSTTLHTTVQQSAAASPHSAGTSQAVSRSATIGTSHATSQPSLSATSSTSAAVTTSQAESVPAASSSAIQKSQSPVASESARSASSTAVSEQTRPAARTVAQSARPTATSQSQAAATPNWQAVVAAVKANAPKAKPTSQPPATSEAATPQAAAPTSAVANKAPVKTGLTLKKQVPLDDQHYQMPPLSLLPNPVKNNDDVMTNWVAKQRQVLDETLKAFNVHASVTRWSIGPAVTQFEVSLARGVKVSKITNLSDDLKLALAAKDIRIEAPIPGKTTVGIEIPNLKSRPVMLSEVVKSKQFQESQSPLTVALGVDLFGQPMLTNVAKMPHGLIAGATGSGKSVFINSLLLSILFKAKPTDVKLLLIDPKAVELAPYNGLPHLLSPVISDPKAAAAALKWAVEEMENRYHKLAAAGVRNLAQFNQKAAAHGDYGLKLPYIIIIIDELADLMMVAANEVQDYIVRITQKARAAGIHLLVATQRPSVDVITGTIKNNIPTRIAFMVSSQIDSRTIIDQSGAERLLGRGDMLYLGNGQSQPVRIQGTYAENEIDKVVAFVKKQLPAHYLFEPEGLLEKVEATENQDDLFPKVLAYIAAEKQVSTSKLQRVFSIGYNRAANLIDTLEQRQLVSPASGSKPRDVYFTKDDLAQYQKRRHEGN